MNSARDGEDSGGAAPPATKGGASALNSHNAFSPMVAFVAVILYVMNFVWVSWRRSSKDGAA